MLERGGGERGSLQAELVGIKEREEDVKLVKGRVLGDLSRTYPGKRTCWRGRKEVEGFTERARTSGEEGEGGGRCRDGGHRLTISEDHDGYRNTHGGKHMRKRQCEYKRKGKEKVQNIGSCTRGIRGFGGFPQGSRLWST